MLGATGRIAISHGQEWGRKLDAGDGRVRTGFRSHRICGLDDSAPCAGTRAVDSCAQFQNLTGSQLLN